MVLLALQAVLGGNDSPSKDDITSILSSGKPALQMLRAASGLVCDSGIDSHLASFRQHTPCLRATSVALATSCAAEARECNLHEQTHNLACIDEISAAAFTVGLYGCQ